MKLTKKVKVAAKKAVPAKTKEVTTIHCDFCNASLPNHGSYGWYPSCDLCGRDVCRKHQVIDDHGDDYPDWYCLLCDEVRREHIGDRTEIETSYHEELERLTYQMKEESLERNTKDK